MMPKKPYLLLNILLSSLCISHSVAAAEEDFDRQQILNRIQPVGQVRLEQTDQAQKTPASTPQVAQKAPGQETYEQYCHVCHEAGVAGAPKFRNQADWKPRTDVMNLAALTASAEKGKNAMPPKGTCSECTTEQIKEAIQYMLPK